MKIILSAGHSTKTGRDRGAISGKWIEGIETARIRSRVYDILKSMGANVYRDPDNTILSESLRNFKLITDENALCIDFHFNASEKKSIKGTEVYVENNPTDKEVMFGAGLVNVVSDTLGTPKRGNFKGIVGLKAEKESQHKSGLGWMRMPGVNALIEFEFLSNADAMDIYNDRLELLCCNLANYIFNFAKENCGRSSRIHIVKSGDTLSKLAITYKTTVTRLKDLNGVRNSVIKVGERLFV